MNLFLIDAIGPFFIGYQKRVVNWSKIPFVNLEQGSCLDQSKIKQILEAFERFVRKIIALGYNGITLDDVAHLVCFDFYPLPVKQKIHQYQELYSRVFTIAETHGVKVFMNTDVMFLNESISQHVETRQENLIDLLYNAVKKALAEFAIDGIIFRIGETDGEDVVGDFKSNIAIKTPGQANQVIKRLLPLFEEQNKILIFRNWTVGPYPIGDLIWNRETHDRAFGDIDSDHFIVSLKYGDTDFFSRLQLNPLFFNNSHKTIIELQTRRERECFGIFPNYVGWDYERYYQQLKDSDNLVGISVWCQTGGWSRNKNLTFVENSSIWNELNTVAAIDIFGKGMAADDVIRRFFRNDAYIAFLRTFNEFFLDLLYIDDYASKTLYFRRTRIPPILWLSWDYATINPLMASIHRGFIDEMKPLDESKIDTIRRFGNQLGIKDIDYCCDTLKIFLLCRKSLLGQFDVNKLYPQVKLFRQKYHPCNFKFKINRGRTFVLPAKVLFKLFTRSTPQYRVIDKVLLNRMIAKIIFNLLMFFVQKRMPKFANKRAMRLDILFK